MKTKFELDVIVYAIHKSDSGFIIGMNQGKIVGISSEKIKDKIEINYSIQSIQKPNAFFGVIRNTVPEEDIFKTRIELEIAATKILKEKIDEVFDKIK